MKRYALFFSGLALFACLFSAQAQNAAEAGQPQFKLLDPSTVSLGRIHGAEAKRVQFHFKNTSSTPASILFFRPTCPCVHGTTDKMKTAPGEEMVVTLIFDPSNVHGSFLRGLWVNFDDPAQKRLLLNVSGEVVPLFAGVPFDPISFQSMDTNVVWTNRLTLTSSEKGYRLGAPQVETNASLRTQVQIAPATNASENAAYDLTLVVTPLALGRHRGNVSLPVEGGSNTPPVRIAFQARVGQALSISPDQINLYASETPVTRRLILRTDDATVNTGALTWEPHVEGLSVQMRLTKRSANILVSLQFSPAAIKQLRAEKDAQLTFRYPNHAPATVRLVAAEGSAAEPEEQ